MVILSGDFISSPASFYVLIFPLMIYYLSRAASIYIDDGTALPLMPVPGLPDVAAIQRPKLLNSSGKSSMFMDSWMKDKVRYSEKDKQKLEKGSGYVKVWTLVSNWVYRVISW
jgi:hypothetical protein